MTTVRKCPATLKLPRLRMKDELLKSAPELAKILGEEVDDPEKEFNTANRLDTPRLYEEELTEEEELQLELRSVKEERSLLVASLAHIKTDMTAAAGGEAQQGQIIQVEKELELKKLKLNELRTECKRLENQCLDVKTQIKDAMLLTPGGYEAEYTNIKNLHADMKRLEDDLIEAEAKNRLYYLLGERTRSDHMDMERKVREAREMKTDSHEDHATLTQHMHDMRAAKEEAERQLAKMKRMFEDAKKDWFKKMRDRKKEVQELKRRQEKEEMRELRRKEKAEEDAKKEKERLARIRVEQEAYEMQIKALAPKLEAMEASWNRLRTISGADEPEEVIAYWEGLKSKEENMRHLVHTAEEAEVGVKDKIIDLINKRNEMLEADMASQSLQQRGGGQEASEEAETRIADAHRKMDTTRKRFEKLRTVCISAEQGLKSIMDKVRLALDEVKPKDLIPESNIPTGQFPSRKPVINRRESMVNRKGTSPYSIKRNATPVKEGAQEGGDVMLEAANGASETLVITQPKNTIDDEAFFEHLPQLLSDVGDKLARLLEIEATSIQEMNEMNARPEPGQVDDEPSDSEDDEPEGEADGAEGDTAEADGPADTPADGGEGADADAGRDSAGEEAAVEHAAEKGAVEAHGAEDSAEAAADDTEAAEGGNEALPEGAAAEPDAVEGAAAGTDADAAATSADAVATEGNAEQAVVTEEAVAEAPTAVAAEAPAPAAPAASAHTSLPAHASSVDRDDEPTEEELEKRMLIMAKGMPKQDWSGAPLISTINVDLRGMVPDLSATTRRTKGKKKADKPVQLERIMGYTADSDVGDSESDGEDDDEKDGVLERDFIKRMAAKMEARAAKEKAEANGASA